jgi:hypothetical protein
VLTAALELGFGIPVRSGAFDTSDEIDQLSHSVMILFSTLILFLSDFSAATHPEVFFTAPRRQSRSSAYGHFRT